MAFSPHLPIALTDDQDVNESELKSSENPSRATGQTDSPERNDHHDAPDWLELVMRIQQGDESGMEDLYRLFARNIRFYLLRCLGVQEVDDKVHDTFLIVVQAIRRGDLREPERLMGFVRTVVRRQVAAHMNERVHNRRNDPYLDLGVRVPDKGRDPEQSTAFGQRVGFMLKTLGQLSDRDGEILTRFYLHEQTQQKICDEMHLTEVQFRLLKSRAKTRFGELGKRKLQQQILVRLSASP